jgi:hypothetical protein
LARYFSETAAAAEPGFIGIRPMTYTPYALAPPAREAAPARWLLRFKALLARRTSVGKAVLTVLVLNEIRGVVVVIMVLACWKAKHG